MKVARRCWILGPAVAFLAQGPCWAQGKEEPPRWTRYARAFAEADDALGRGAFATARGAFERCLELSPANPTVAYGLASTESRAGDREAALAWLERAIEWGFRDGSLARWDEDLAALRGEARFVKLLEGVPEATRVEEPRVFLEPPESSPLPVAVAIDPPGERVLVGYGDGSLELLDARAGELVRSLRPRESAVWKTVFSPDGASFAALFHDGTLGIWKTAGGEAVFLGRAVAESRRAEQWHELMGVDDLGPYMEQVARIEWDFGAVLTADPAGNRLLVAAAEGRGVGLWTWGGELVREWDLSEPPHLYFHVPFIWSPDGATIALASENDVRLFDGRTGAERSRLSCPSPLRSLDFHPSGERLVTGHDDGYVREWKLADGSLVWERSVEKEYENLILPAEVPAIGWVSYSPDGKALACTTVVVVRTIVLDTETRNLRWAGPSQGGRMGEPAEVTWSPDGSRLWSTYLSGLWLMTVDLRDPAAEPVNWPHGFVPRFSARRTEHGEPELGVTILNGTHVTLLEAHDGAVRWMRTRDAQGAVLLQTAGGRLATTLDDFRGWTVGPRPHEHDNPVALGPRLEELLDPKRVRASCAGVR